LKLSGTGLSKFQDEFPKRFFDVGIAEQHGVTLAAGLASNGMRPFFAVYSTFLQRGYDQILHDVCIQNLPVTFAIDRAGLVGDDGETHHGVFDFSFLSHIPNMTIMAPKDETDFIEMIRFAASHNGPIALRYPRGECSNLEKVSNSTSVEYGKGEILNLGKDVAIIAVGKMVEEGYKVLQIFKDEGRNITLANGRFIKPLDEELVMSLANNHRTLVTMEDNVLSGGFGSSINNILITNGYKGQIINIGLPDSFVEHGSVEELYKEYNLDAESVHRLIKEKIEL